MPRNSQQDADGIVWQTVSLPLGAHGLDLRTPVDANALSELLNARFQDERTAIQRDGHDSQSIYDGGNVAALGPAINVPGVWVLGHGIVVAEA